MLLPGSQDTKVLLFLPVKGVSEARTTPLPCKSQHKEETEGFFLLAHLCLTFPALLFRISTNCFKGRWEGGSQGTQTFFIYNIKLCSPYPVSLVPFSLLNASRQETHQLREDGDCGTRFLGAHELKGPELWADTVSCRLWGASHIAVSW